MGYVDATLLSLAVRVPCQERYPDVVVLTPELLHHSVYCLLVNRAQFLHEQSHLSNTKNVNFSRATLCELIATRILRRFGEDNPGQEGLVLLSNILVAGFEPFQKAPETILRQAEDNMGWIYQRPLPALEVAILTESKHFLSSTMCQKV